jgi:hypothetical protein
LFYNAQLPRHSEAKAPRVQGGTATHQAGSSPWHHSCDAGFAASRMPGSSIQTSEERLRGQATCEAIRVKPKLQWSPKEIRDTRKATKSKQSQPKREGMCGATSKAIGVGCLNPLKFTSCHTPHVLDAGYEATGFSVYPARFQSCFGLMVPYCSPIPPFLERYCLFCAILSWKYASP